MKTKLTLTIERKIIERAKRIAQRRGKSLSKMVEDAFGAPDNLFRLPDHKQSALMRLRELHIKSKSARVLNPKDEKKRKNRYLLKKYG